jgi:hypothetical protein
MLARSGFFDTGPDRRRRGGNWAVFLLLDESEVYGLPPDPVVPARELPAM